MCNTESTSIMKPIFIEQTKSLIIFYKRNWFYTFYFLLRSKSTNWICNPIHDKVFINQSNNFVTFNIFIQFSKHCANGYDYFIQQSLIEKSLIEKKLQSN